jgi:uncharacterized protein (DUF885 family)
MMSSLVGLGILAGVHMMPAPNPAPSYASHVVHFIADEQDIQNKYWLDQSPSDRERLATLYSDTLADMKRQDFDGLSREGQIDYILLRTSIENRSRNLGHEQDWYRKEKPLAPFAEEIFALEQSRRDAKPIAYEKVANRLAAIRGEIQALQADPATLHTDKILAYRVTRLLDQVNQCLDNWNRFYSGYDPLYDWWIPTPLKALEEALKSYETFLTVQVVGIKQDDPSTIIGSPIGRQALIDELQGAMIDYSPEELIQIAEKEYAWSESQMIAASREMGCGDDWKKALDKVRQLHEPPGGQPQLIKSLADEAVKYVTSNDLVTVPPLASEAWTMEMMTPLRQYENPFFTGGRTISVSFPTNDMSQDQKEMSLGANNRYFARATVFHELIPGHWLQQYNQARYRTYRSDLNNNPFWIEGWAFYWEMLLYSRGFATTPEERVGMLFWRMHRSARVIFSLKFHLGEWTPQQCVNYLVAKVGHERFTAEGEVRRSLLGGYGPLYQLAYMMGALQFRQLHHDLVESGSMSDKAFHDAVLQGNEMPIELVRASFSHEKLTRDFKTHWRFYPLGTPTSVR